MLLRFCSWDAVANKDNLVKLIWEYSIFETDWVLTEILLLKGEADVILKETKCSGKVFKRRNLQLEHGACVTALWTKPEVSVWKVSSSYIIIQAGGRLRLISQADDDPPRPALLIIA